MQFSEFDPARDQSDDGRVAVLDTRNLDPGFEIGIDSAITGKASAESIVCAVDAWKRGEIDAIATAPISKKAIQLAGYDYPGHTEFLAELTGTAKFAMSFFADRLRVVLLSTHISLLEAVSKVTAENLFDLITFTDVSLEGFSVGGRVWPSRA